MCIFVRSVAKNFSEENSVKRRGGERRGEILLASIIVAAPGLGNVPRLTKIVDSRSKPLAGSLKPRLVTPADLTSCKSLGHDVRE